MITLFFSVLLLLLHYFKRNTANPVPAHSETIYHGDNNGKKVSSRPYYDVINKITGCIWMTTAYNESSRIMMSWNFRKEKKKEKKKAQVYLTIHTT